MFAQGSEKEAEKKKKGCWDSDGDDGIIMMINHGDKIPSCLLRGLIGEKALLITPDSPPPPPMSVVSSDQTNNVP